MEIPKISQLKYVELKKLKPHPKNIEIYGDEEPQQDFLDSIKSKGILVPIAIKEDGTIISGHRRWKAALSIGLQKVPVEVVSYADDLEERMAIIEYNRQREKTFSQKMAEAEEIKAIESERARARQVEHGETAPGRPKNTGGNISTTESDTGKTRDKVAKTVGLGSGRNYEKAAKVWEAAKKGDDVARKLVEEIDQGKQTINQAYQNIRKQEKIRSIEEKFVEKEETTSTKIDIYHTGKKYNIIYADPPWRYWEGGLKNQSLHYPTMTIDEICSLPIKNIAADDCILFLWCTYPILQEGFKVIESWGFTYSTVGFVWVKRNKSGEGYFFGNGSWTRANTELCLLAIKGTIVRLDASISQIIDSPIEEHSKKPDITRDLITRLVGPLPRIELFARNVPQGGWDIWGNEV